MQFNFSRLQFRKYSVMASSGLCALAFSSTCAFAGSTDKPAEAAAAAKSPVLVLLIYDDSCQVSCTKVRPVMRELADKHNKNVKYVELNTSEKAMDDSRKLAKTLGVHNFLEVSTDDVPVVGIFDAKGKKLKNLQGFKAKDVYTKAVDDAVAK